MYWELITNNKNLFRITTILILFYLLCSVTVSAQGSFTAEKRQGIHDLIDQKQLTLDLFDGDQDNNIDLGNPRDTELANTSFLTLINLLQTSIETSSNTDLIKYNDLVGIYNLIVNLSSKSIQYVNYHHTNIYNAYGIISHKSLGSLDLYLYNHMLTSLKNVTLFKDENIAEQFLKDAAEQYPTELLKSAKGFKSESYAKGVIEHTAKVAPNTIKKYFPTRSFINAILLESKDPAVQLLMDIYKHYGSESKAYFFLDKVEEYPDKRGYYSYLFPDSEVYLKELIDIRRSPDPLAEYSLNQELKIQALKYVRVINDMHLMKDATDRFTSVDSMSIEELYTLIVYTAEEIFTSTFNGIFGRYMTKMQADSIDGFEFLMSMNFIEFRTFIKLNAGYNTLNEFLGTMTPKNQERLFKKFATNLGENLADLGEAVNVADTFGSLEDSTQLKKFLLHLTNAYHQEVEDQNINGEVIYSLLISLIGEKIELVDSLLSEIELQELPPLDKIEITELFNKDSVNIQQHFFFDDDDGLYSYGTFIQYYKNNSWKIIDSMHYVIIESNTGNDVKIFANKPLSEREGQKEIKEYFERMNIAPAIMVHRGHSYYVHLTIENVQPETRMVFLGSCGGYHNLTQVIDRSPKVHIISSKQIGTVLVNNPLLYSISESIRKGENVDWANIWETVGNQLKNQKKANEKFQDYIPPHKNLGAIFLQAYYELTG